MKNTIASLLLFALSNLMMVSCNEEIDDSTNPFEALNLPDVEFN
jgi:hypothetical protein